MSDQIEQDAEEFGKHIRAGGWRMGLLVARNVQRRVGQGARRDLELPPNQAEVGKVSATEFARMAGLSGHDVVLRYLDAWDRQAPDYGLPTADKLDPGDEVKLPDPKDYPFRATDPEATAKFTGTVTTHESTGRYEPSGQRGRKAAREDDGEDPGSAAHRWIVQADEALTMLASHRSAWQFMTDEDYQTLAELPAKVRAILADIDFRMPSVRRH